MKVISRIILTFAAIFFGVAAFAADSVSILSPDGNLTLSVNVKDGVPYYDLSYKNISVLSPSRLGFRLKYERGYVDSMCIQGSVETTVDEYWYPVWGEYAKVRNNYNELFVTFTQEGSGRILGVRFRLFNDGLGFRYEFPEQPTLHIFQVEEELT
ncbi:MAG: glycoside hydrolase family 97 N-terminal domain-containing protein, partial [Candidatus Cryptobacteroides sp.]|nr:glycoside hydrolase family 97 N-terminal domain-containing protein [Candidatus Cryptobacteroides sp.]